MFLCEQRVPQNPAPTQQGRISEEECNRKLASIFGGPGSPVSTVNEPSGINPNYAGDNRIHHLANNGVLHIYGNAQATTTDAPLYRPPGGTFLRRGSGEYEEKIDGVGTGNYSNVFQFSYSGGLVIKFFHVGGTSGGVEGGARLGRYPWTNERCRLASHREHWWSWRNRRQIQSFAHRVQNERQTN